MNPTTFDSQAQLERAQLEKKLFEGFVGRERVRIRTWERTRNAVEALLRAFEERRSVSVSAEAWEVLQVLSRLHGGNARTTRALVLGCWRAWYRFLEDEGCLLSLRPAELIIRGPLRSLPTKVPTPGEVTRWLGLCEPRCPWGVLDRAMLEIVYGCGLRAGELWSLELEDLDLGASVLLVRTSKNGRGRTLPIPDQTLAALRRYLDQRQTKTGQECWLWTGPDGERVPRHYLKYRIRAVYRAKLEFGAKLSQRSLRHAFATHLLQRGAGVGHIQVLLGHRDIRSTAIYTKVEPLEVKRAVEKAMKRVRKKAGISAKKDL